MRTQRVLAKNLHAGMFLVERQGVKRAALHICEVQIDRKQVKIRVNNKDKVDLKSYKRTERVTVKL